MYELILNAAEDYVVKIFGRGTTLEKARAIARRIEDALLDDNFLYCLYNETGQVSFTTSNSLGDVSGF